MKTTTRSQANPREGGVLLMAMFVMLVFSVLAIGLFKLRETDAVESVYVEQYKQAFWLAETGLSDGELLIKHDEFFRDTPWVTTKTNTTVNGSYVTTVVKTTVDASQKVYDFEITSIGTVSGQSRRLRKSIQSRPGGEFAIIGIKGVMELGPNVTIGGPIAQISGDVNVHDSRGLDGYLIVADGVLDDKKGEANLVNYPPPPAPSIKYDDYLLVMTKASTLTPYTETTNVMESVISGVHYFNSKDVIIWGTGTTISDEAYIVNTGNISFPKSHVTIGKKVTIIANTFSIANKADIGGETLIFAAGNPTLSDGNSIYLRNASDTSTIGEAAVVLLAQNGNIEFDSNIDFRGIIFAETGIVNINANGTIEGTIIGGVGVGVDANITINYDASVFTAGTPVIPEVFKGVILTTSSWQELAPL